MSRCVRHAPPIFNEKGYTGKEEGKKSITPRLCPKRAQCRNIKKTSAHRHIQHTKPSNGGEREGTGCRGGVKVPLPSNSQFAMETPLNSSQSETPPAN